MSQRKARYKLEIFGWEAKFNSTYLKQNNK